MPRMRDAEAYRNWIAENVQGDGYGQCNHISRKMQAAFPELRIARGAYDCPSWGRRLHWWLVTEDGTVVDPTAAQFPSGGLGRYEEWADDEVEERCPIGKCANCGDEIYKSDNAPCDMICSEECGRAYTAYLSGFARE
jgi:hypothetical protein